jgi:hypothetical protein
MHEQCENACKEDNFYEIFGTRMKWLKELHGKITGLPINLL